MRSLPLKLHAEPFAMVRLEPGDPIPAEAMRASPCFITRTRTELSVIAPVDALGSLVAAGSRFRLFTVDLRFGTTEIGILKSLVDPLAAGGVSLLAVCSHDTDHVLVESSRVDEAVLALRDAGHTVEST